MLDHATIEPHGEGISGSDARPFEMAMMISRALSGEGSAGSSETGLSDLPGIDFSSGINLISLPD